MATLTRNSRAHQMSTAEPHARPSHELKETCIFWYHGNCDRGDDCPFEHELNHNWPLARPPGYTHRWRCDLQFCPLRTDLVEFIRKYYPDGPRIDDITQEVGAEHEEAAESSVALADEQPKSDGNKRGEGWIGLDSESNSKENVNVAPSSVSAAGVTSVDSSCSDTVESQAPSASAAPPSPPQALAFKECLLPLAQDLDTDSTASEHAFGLTGASTKEDHTGSHPQVDPGSKKKNKKRIEGVQDQNRGETPSQVTRMSSAMDISLARAQ